MADRTWRVPAPRDPGRANAKLSAGFYGIALAAHICGSVDVYGFRASDNHYYKKLAKVGRCRLTLSNPR
jgi:hypothetical protein